MQVDVRLLGGFDVVIDGQRTPPDRWTGRQSSALVKLLALAPNRRLHRDRVIDALWPAASVEAALPRLHKAAHFARVALGQRTAIVLRDEIAVLFPEADVTVDAFAFETAALAALAEQPVSAGRCVAVLDGAAELLPEDLHAPWLDEPRERLRLLSARVARAGRLWEAVLDYSPADEQAHLELMRAELARGDRSAALRRYSQLTQVLETDLGVRPSPEADELHQRAVSMPIYPAGGAPPLDAPAAGPMLVEREAELSALSATVHRACRERRGTVILIPGEAGVGKSALVRALLGRLEDSVTAFVGGCDDLLAPRSLGPFRDMSDEHTELGPAMATSTLDQALPMLLHVVAAGPSIVVIEDIHWADDATYDAIRFLARRIREQPVALLLTFRDEVEPDHPLRQLLGGLAGLPVQRVAPAPLTARAVQCLGELSEQEAADIVGITGGNPFFVTEVLATHDTDVPATVRDAVLARVGRLSPAVRTLVRRMSVIPTRAARPIAEGLAGGNRLVVVDAERSGVMVGGTDWVAFRHELARQAIETSLLPGERVDANTLVVDALLAQRDIEPARVLHHAARSRRTELILAYGPRAAGEASALGAHRQAAEALKVVLQHASGCSPPEHAELATRLAYSLYVVNRYEEALHYAEAAVRAAEGADAISLADALLVLSRVVLFARGPSEARAAAARAVDLLRSAGDDARLAAALAEHARAHSNLATIGIVAEPSDTAAMLSEQALDLSEHLGRADLAAQALCYRGDARLAAGDPRGADDLRRAVALVSADARLETRVRAHVNAAGGAYRSGRFDDALAYVEDGLRIAADGEFFAGQYRLRLTAAAVHASRGEWDTAVTELRTLIESPGEPGMMAALARSLLARLLARRGDTEAATVLSKARADPLGRGEDAFLLGVLTLASVELGWLDGTLGGLTPAIEQALTRTRGQYAAIHAELCGYLVRAGIAVPAPTRAPGPWGPTLARRWLEASAAWRALGERYEYAVVLATAANGAERTRGLRVLDSLGAAATIAAL